MTTQDQPGLADGLRSLSISEAQDVAPTANIDSKRSNFPLPRELRDQIYGYLLYHQHVMCAPLAQHDDDGRDYRFHTNILGTNRQIREEAMDVFVSNNFVLVSLSQWVSDICRLWNMCMTICKGVKAVERFQHRHVTIRVCKDVGRQSPGNEGD